MNEFDKWRSNYDTMTIGEQIAYHNELEAKYPEQNHFNYERVKEALSVVQENVIDIFYPTVLEFGTWKGDLALKAFEDFKIHDWIGIEICEAAIRNTKCARIKYVIPDRFDWFKEKRLGNPDIVIATHFIEHLSNEHFKDLANYIKGIRYVHFESPLTDGGNDWEGYEGTHKLTLGWNQINEIMAANGFKLIINHPESKTYES